MRWRLEKLSWAYALGELAIVVVGVMIALAFDQWNSDRLELVEEREVVERLTSDVQEDLQNFERQLQAVNRKEASLIRIRSALSADTRPDDPSNFLSDLMTGALYGWSQAVARRTTFNELLSSGRFGLIRDAALRVRISQYYDFDSGSSRRIEERETAFPQLTYRLIPRQEGTELDRDLRIESGLETSDLELIVETVFGSELREHIIAEINLARFTRGQSTELLRECGELLDALESYRDRI